MKTAQLLPLEVYLFTLMKIVMNFLVLVSFKCMLSGHVVQSVACQTQEPSQGSRVRYPSPATHFGFSVS